MKLERPPKVNKQDYQLYFKEIEKNPKIVDFFKETDKRYFYWSELKYRPDSPSKNASKNWTLVKLHRYFSAKRFYFRHYPFSLNITTYIQQDLHEFDLKLIGGLYKDSITPEDRDEYFKNSLVEEAIASSQIEGAATTTDIAREMIKSGREPRTESEQMIFNNFAAIKEIENRLEDKLDAQLILDIHQIMTRATEAKIFAGKFRSSPIYVKDHLDGEIAHVAPDHVNVIPMIDELCKFVNDDEEFIHPILKASILHFMIGFIHPFGDGNGRTARALFYWLLMKKGYNLIRHISISRAILNSRTSYDKAFLKTEYDENDLTYFIMYSIKSLKLAFKSLVEYRDKKRADREKASEIIYELLKKKFNKRQADLLGYLYLKPDAEITIPVYSKRHEIVRQTGSKDLIELSARGFLESFKAGKHLVFKLIDRDKISMMLR